MNVKFALLAAAMTAFSASSVANTDVAPIAFVEGVRGKAIQLNGNETFLQDPVSKPFAIKNGFTVSLWIKPDHWTQMASLFGNLGDFQMLVRGSGGVYFWKQNTHQFGASGAKTLLWAPKAFPAPMGKWSHIAFSYDQKGHGIGYFNGRKVAEQLPGQEPRGQGIVQISPTPRHKAARLDVGFRFQGAMDDLYLYGRVLTEAEVLALSKGNAPAGAFAVYLMDDPNRPGLDSSGSGRHLEPVMGPLGKSAPILGYEVDAPAVASDRGVTAYTRSSLDRVFQRDHLKEIKVVAEQISAELAGNEYEAFQLVLTPNRELKNVTLTVPDFKLGKTVCPVEVRLVDYVKIPTPSNIKTKRSGENVFGEMVSVYPGPEAAPGWYPDRLRVMPKSFTLKAKECQAFWITVKSPKNAPAGIYRTVAEVRAADGTVLQIPLNIRVRGFSLPDKLSSAHTTAVRAAYLSEVTDLDGFYRVLSRYYISTADYKSSVGVSFAADGSIKLDTAAWDREMEIAVGKYHQKEIFIPSFGIYGIPKADDGAGTRMGIRVSNGKGELTPEFKEKFGKYIEAMAAHLKEKGWFEMARMTLVDEPHSVNDFKLCREVAALVRQHAPGLKIMITKWPTAESIGCADIWCIGALQPEQVAKAIARGETVEQYPNWHMLIDRPSMDRRMLGFQMFKYHLSGVLHYALNKGSETLAEQMSPQLRYPDGRVIYGSGLVMYPGKNGVPDPSVRIDTVRDALEDYEYLKMIEKIAAERPNDQAAQEALAYAKNAAEKLVPCYESYGNGLKAGWKTLLWELDWKVLLEYRKGLLDRLEQLNATPGK